jgi:phosphoribosylanthranilate isomerase
VFVKICGITRPEDALLAAERGASAIGFVFWPRSPRLISAAAARAIRATLPPAVQAVGVFVNQSVDEVNAFADAVRLSAVQLHGEEDADFVAQMKVPVIKAVTFGRGAVNPNAWPPDVVLLVDAHDPVRYGGTGTRVDWSAAAALAKTRRVLLAGGLTPENVGDAVSRVNPFGVDVSSGVESAPGIKNRERLDALFEALRRMATA